MKNHLILISFNSGRFAIDNGKQYHSYGHGPMQDHALLMTFSITFSHIWGSISRCTERTVAVYTEKNNLKKIKVGDTGIYETEF